MKQVNYKESMLIISLTSGNYNCNTYSCYLWSIKCKNKSKYLRIIYIFKLIVQNKIIIIYTKSDNVEIRHSKSTIIFNKSQN